MSWAPPLRGNYRLTASYGQRGPHWKTYHTGQDFAAPKGSPVYAVDDGRVVGRSYDPEYGNLLKIQHAGGLQSWYAHLDRFMVLPLVGVKKGQQIGTVGLTGDTTGAHTHLEARLNGQHRDPMPYISGSAPTTPAPPDGGTADPDAPTVDVSKLTDPGTWQRIAMFIGGAALLITSAIGARKSGMFG